MRGQQAQQLGRGGQAVLLGPDGHEHVGARAPVARVGARGVEPAGEQRGRLVELLQAGNGLAAERALEILFPDVLGLFNRASRLRVAGRVGRHGHAEAVRQADEIGPGVGTARVHIRVERHAVERVDLAPTVRGCRTE